MTTIPPIAAFAGAKIAFLHDTDLLTYLRDDKPSIPWPAHWDFAGGGREGDETPEACALRETHEEFSLKIEPSRIIWSRKYPATQPDALPGWFFVAPLFREEIGQIRFGNEGQHWRMMPVTDFLSRPDAVAPLQHRLWGLFRRHHLTRGRPWRTIDRLPFLLLRQLPIEEARATSATLMKFNQLAFVLLAIAMTVFSIPAAVAQNDPPIDPEPVIEAAPPAATDQQIEARINEIFAEISSLGDVTVSVNAGVVTLGGMTQTAEAASRAETLATRVSGVATVENEIERDVSVTNRVTPAVSELSGQLNDIIRFLPLLGLALLIFVLIYSAGAFFARWSWFWTRITPNAFIAEIASTSVRLIFVVIAAVAALGLLDATALLSAFLGAAGVIGLAVGFAVRDTIENYIASIMLSLRQPFRPNDLVVIDSQQGHVIRLTSRATILMTLDGNHLRIPNATVFKAVILNYSRNPERRFDFELGIDADDDPLAGIETGIKAIEALDFVLKDPAPIGFIKDVGDSNIVLFFGAWIDQRDADFSKSRSAALTAAKNALEAAGFALPEPIYRLRFDANTPAVFQNADLSIREADASSKPQTAAKPKETPPAPVDIDVTPDTDIARKVAEEQQEEGGVGLLQKDAPTE